MLLRRILLGGPLQAARKVKETTGLVGLPVVPDAREKLIDLYRKTLVEVQTVPETAQYRKIVERFTRFRLKVCEEEEDWEEIEKRIQSGQVEQLLKQAENELKLIPKMVEWQPWDVPEGHTLKVIEDDTPIPSHVPVHRETWTPPPPDDEEPATATEQEKKVAA